MYANVARLSARSLVLPYVSALFLMLLISLTLGWSGAVSAQQGSTSGCPVPALRQLPDSNPPSRTDAPIWADSDTLTFVADDGALLEGDVKLERADQVLTTETLLYNQREERVTVPAPLTYQDQMLRIEAADGEFSLARDQGRFDSVLYQLTGGAGNGMAQQIQVYGPDQAQLTQFTYTTCDPQQPDWLLSAGELNLYPESGYGTARNATLRFQGVPILYAPWFRFPTDDRRVSGLLYPRFASSNDNGVEYHQPIYWNIAPNQDATITPGWYSERGAALEGEYRYLARTSTGQVDFNWLPDDDEFGDDRYRYQWRHLTAFSARWRSNIYVDRVSDIDYFQDFGTGLYETSRQFLRSRAVLSGRGEYWNFDLLADDFQVLDDSVSGDSEPYQRLPRAYFTLDRPLDFSGLPVDFSLGSELVYFTRDEGITGTRLDLYPELSLDFVGAAGFLRPALGFRHTSYALDDPEARFDPEIDEEPTRNLPIVSVDTGLYFERLNGDGGWQTLEPRLFYLYVPFEEQDDLPDFDTTDLTFGFSQLFATNRFVGADRQTDANQLTLALSTRNYAANAGYEKWSASIGQIVYFDTPAVSLPGAEPPGNDVSPAVVELNWRPMRNLAFRFGLQWDWEDDQADLGVFGTRWEGGLGQQVAFDYRFRRDRVDQADIRMRWPINDRWNVLGRWNYSFDDDDTLEALAGVEYESCCWALRVVGRRYLRNRDGDFRNGVYLELELKGLGSVGRPPYQLFRPEEFRY